MGYTHYWRCNPSEVESHAEFGALMSDMRRIADSDHGALISACFDDGAVDINGVGSDAHETFTFPPRHSFEFCKTRQKPYDTVVTACLAAAKHRLGDAIRVSSDGDARDWERGVALASRVLGEMVANPIGCDDAEED